MLIESSAYASRWRDVAPSAKALFALAGVIASWLAQSPAALAALTAILMLTSLLAARVPLRAYLAVALPPLGFLLLSCLTMLVGPDSNGHWHLTTAMLPTIQHTALRSLAMLAALLGLVLTTPMPDLLALLRTLRTPELLLDLMVLCYRMLFVLRQAWDESITAQTARLGYRNWRQAWRSTGLLAGQMAVQVWQRAAALQTAADARAYQGTLRFMPATYPQAARQVTRAALAGAVMLAIALGERL
ncbi:cobalt/nickel transport system permease protein [Duganella sp. 1224]|uniref:cobalt ECF transporter T component CbiQ n=1 Tax=Duganella sp. 1224 TaxID=2587052 RepID=UPI0015C8C4A6|nr:cobalt/nickel transport system permease protein [Duganella sp. 1224]